MNGNGLTAKEMTLRYIDSLESRIKTLEKRETLWVVIILGSVGVNVGHFTGVI